MNVREGKSKGSLLGWSLVVCGVVCVVFLGFLLQFGARDHVLKILEWLSSLGIWGPVVFILIEIVVVMLILPGAPFTLGAGFLFGPVRGTAYVVIGHTLGGVLAMVSARKLKGRQAAEFIRRLPRLNDLDRHLREKGWQTIMLTRLVPFFPFKLSNYAFGLMGFGVRDFLVGTFIGMIPIAATNVYAGSIAADLATMGSLSERSALQWTTLGLGLAALLLLVLILAKIAQKSLDLDSEDSE